LDGDQEDKKDVGEGAQNVGIEQSVVPSADAVVDPGAVVIEAGDASVADIAVP
jgi:hypothetical protein